MQKLDGGNEAKETLYDQLSILKSIPGGFSPVVYNHWTGLLDWWTDIFVLKSLLCSS